MNLKKGATDDLVLEWEVDSGHLHFTLVDIITFKLGSGSAQQKIQKMLFLFVLYGISLKVGPMSARIWCKYDDWC